MKYALYDERLESEQSLLDTVLLPLMEVHVTQGSTDEPFDLPSNFRDLWLRYGSDAQYRTRMDKAVSLLSEICRECWKCKVLDRNMQSHTFLCACVSVCMCVCVSVCVCLGGWGSV